jgi:myo-inositol 2-dehydrogenase / D-chiro-inositol 1-dehydrogenase
MSRTRSSRRDFLKRSAAVLATGVTAPYFWPGRQAKAQSANDRPGVGAIGVGGYPKNEGGWSFGRGSEIAFQAAKFGDLVACCDVDRSHAGQFAGRFGGKCKSYGDFRKILDRKDVDVVTIGTPDHWHTAIAVAALKAGKDVYCEKPLTLTLAEGKLLCDTVRETGRVFQVGTQQRSEDQGMFLKAVALARSGRLGRRLHAISSVGTAETGGPFNAQPVPETLDFDFWLGQAARVDYCPTRTHFNFRWWIEYSGGQITDWGVHHTDIALWALGGDETGICEAQGKGGFPLGAAPLVDYMSGKTPNIVGPNCYNVATTFDCALKLPNGNTIQLVSDKNELIIRGELGKIRVNRGSLTGKPIEEMSNADKQWLEEEVAKLYRNMPHNGHAADFAHMANFFHCVKTRQKPISDVFSHVNSVNACHIANLAMMLGRKLTWDAQAYDFVGDNQASRLRTRPQRNPYSIEKLTS